jgi:membrane-associated phospholipid phosphatase
MSFRFAMAVSLACVTATASQAQAVPQLSRQNRALISAQQIAVVGLTLFAAGFGDEGLRNEFLEYRSSTTNSVARLGNAFGEPRYVFPVIGAGYLAGRLTGNESLSRVSLRAGTAALLASGITTALKYTVGRTRPAGDGDGDVFRPFSGATSFPSGHTTLAFAVATVMAGETRDSWSDIAFYGAATLTGLARMNGDRHWASDVIAGALIGHLTARWLDRRAGSLRIGPGGAGFSLGF